MEIVNLMIRDITIISNGIKKTFPSEGNARIEEKFRNVSNLEEVPISLKEDGKIKGLPKQTGLNFFIVPRNVMESMKSKRLDLLCPGEPILDERGIEVAYRSLSF